MKLRKIKSAIILTLIILLFILLSVCYTWLNIIENNDNTQQVVKEEILDENTLAIKKIIEKYRAKYIDFLNPTVYAEFEKKLYEEDGNSNQDYFYSIIEELKPLFVGQTFYLIDNEKEIYICVKYDFQQEKHIVIINDMENFYEIVEGEDYAKVDSSEIVKESYFTIEDYYLVSLIVKNFYFSSIKDNIGEGVSLENGYVSYLDGNMELRTIPTGGVRNIIYKDGYETNITNNINLDTPLKEILENEPDNAFGSLKKEYLGYRQDDYYVFFYDDEISFYPYSYEKNDTFELILEEYINSRNLNSFVRNLSTRWMAYDYFEYDSESESAEILYSTRGIHIKIENNNPKGITFYSNYYFTDYTKSLVKKGVVSFEPDKDLVEKTELERRKNN